MKALLLAMLVLFTSPAFADNPIRAQGRGPTLEAAKNNAFRSAVEIGVGSAIVSEQEMANNALRDDIVNYSAGYVDKYEIVKQSQTAEGYYVIVDVWVASSKIQNRILGVSKMPKKMDGDRISTQYSTFLHQKSKGDELLALVLNDYPKRAYVVSVGVHQLKIDINRNAVLEIPIEIRWNPNYIIAMNEALNVLQDGSNGFLKASPGNVVTMFKDPKDLVLGTKSHFKFNDLVYTDSIRRTWQTREPRLRLEIRDFANSPSLVQCYTPDSILGSHDPFYNSGSTLVVFGNNIERNKIELHFDQTAIPILKRQISIDVTVVSDENCH